MNVHRLRLLSIVVASTLLQGLSCDSTNEPSVDFCEVELSGNATVPLDELGFYAFTMGQSWSDSPDAAWSGTGPGTVTFGEPSPRDGGRSAAFTATGEYTLTATLSESGSDAICEETSASFNVTVVAALDDCAGRFTGPIALDVGQTGRYEVFLDSRWQEEAEGNSYEASWTITAGPPGGATQTDRRLTIFSEWAEYRFDIAGVYTLEARFTHAFVGTAEDEFACPELVLEIQITVGGATPTSIPTGVIASPVPAPDGLLRALGIDWEQELGTDAAVLVATERGIAAVDLRTQNVIANAQRLVDQGLTSPLLGMALLGSDDPAASLSMFEFGASGAVLTQWDRQLDEWFVFGRTIEFSTPVLDALAILGDDSGCTYVTGAGQVNQLQWDSDIVDYASSTLLNCGDLGFNIPGCPVSAVASSVGGSALVITNGTPGKIYLWHDEGNGLFATDAGVLGNTPRRVRCESGIAVVTNFDSNSINIFTWDGAGSLTSAGTRAVGDGPVGVDLLSRDGGGVFALTTGFNDHTYCITEIDAAGSVVSSTTANLPTGLLNPAHGEWVLDDDDSFVISCFGSDQLFVGRK